MDDLLIQASREGDLVALERALEGGADLSARDAEKHYTALIWAARNGHAEVVRSLSIRGVDLEVTDNLDAAEH